MESLHFDFYEVDMKDSNNLDILIIDDTVYKTKLTSKYIRKGLYKPKDKSVVNAFIPGTIRKIYVTEGQKVSRGEKLLILEAMKMKNDIVSPEDGIVKSIKVTENQVVTKSQLLVELEL